MMGDGTLSDGMTARMHRSLGGGLPGHYDIGQAPAPDLAAPMTHIDRGNRFCVR